MPQPAHDMPVIYLIGQVIPKHCITAYTAMISAMEIRADLLIFIKFPFWQLIIELFAEFI